MHAIDRTLTTRTGFTVAVRRAEPGDVPALAAFFEKLTPEDRRFRFLTAVAHVSSDQLKRMTAGNPEVAETLLGLSEEGELIAVAMLAIDQAAKRGEIAISILPPYKARGISWALLGHLVEEAKARGIETVESLENRENRAAITLEQEMGFTARSVEGDPTLVLLSRGLG